MPRYNFDHKSGLSIFHKKCCLCVSVELLYLSYIYGSGLFTHFPDMVLFVLEGSSFSHDTRGYVSTQYGLIYNLRRRNSQKALVS